MASWSLITDGVFNSRPLEAAAIVDALTDDLGSKLLLEALDGRAITALPEASHAGAVWERLTQAITVAPGHPNNCMRTRVIRDLLGLRRQFARWWVERITQAIGTESEVAWLKLGAACEVIAGEVIDIPGLSAQDGERAQLILNTGGLPQEGSILEEQLRRAVLDGQCSETTSVRSELASMAVAVGPAEFYSFGAGAAFFRPKASWPDRRSQAIQQLRRSGSALAGVAGLRRFQRGEKGSTFPWSNVSTALYNEVGRCWLVTEIAVIGAAMPLHSGYAVLPGAQALGAGGHPAALIAQTRAHARDVTWWRDQLKVCDDDHSQAEWALALWAIAAGDTIDELLTDFKQRLDLLPVRWRRVIRIAALRLGEAGLLAGRPVTATTATSGLLAEMLDARAGRASAAVGVKSSGTWCC